ncbi:MAG: ABC transporter ATP-binding protein [Saprospiraceae bacterium]|nr:ABC transporter ATP-binding protein [Saprospiraceae bacterium]MBK7812603.1 ABC transporter ATP-binding protein [Saprospiraceae bacterium]MBK9630794.1 ABC transporter ATP-binding protein [Saprospiraceae bacterium]
MLELIDINKYFGEFSAVKDLSLKVSKGDVYGFLGPNGAGKSTTLRMILGLIKPTSGEIFFREQKIDGNSKDYLKDIGSLIERAEMYESLGAQDNLRLLGKLSNVHPLHSRVDDILNEVGLYDRRKSKVKTYSQGMKQRLGIAQAVLHQPSLLILDEPSNGLDPQGQIDIRNLILKINKERDITIIISSHILSEIELMANRMIILSNGKKVIEGEVQSLLTEKDMKVKIKIDKISNLEHICKNNEALIVHTEKAEDLFEVELQMAFQAIPDLISELNISGIKVFQVNPIRSLEEYYIKATSHV